MSLFGSLQIGRSSLFASQVGLQVTANNIANASTPGYIRQRPVLTPQTTQRIGNLTLGLGVHVEAIVQQTDRFLEERVRAATSDLTNSQTQEKAYLQLEAVIGELGDNDISSSMNQFFAAVQEVLNQPEDAAVRNHVVMQGEVLAADIRRLDTRVRDLKSRFDDEITAVADDINRLVNEIAELNVKIVTTEGSMTTGSDAVGLRDKRNASLTELSQLVGIRTVEQPTGAMNVFVGGDYLVFGGEVREVSVFRDVAGGEPSPVIQIEDIGYPLQASSGQLAGMYAARDEILGGFQSSLDHLAHTLAFEFNKLYSSGQGMVGYQDLTSFSQVEDTNVALDEAGLDFTPQNGSFQLLVHDPQTDTSTTTDIYVKLNGLDDDTSLTELAAALDAVDGIQASIGPQRDLRITSENDQLEFAFGNDTSGALAALGISTFFTGSEAVNLNVNEVVRNTPTTFAASRGGIGVDAKNAELLGDFANRALESQDGQTLVGIYEQIVGETAQASSATRAVTEGFQVFQRTLEGQHLSISGVNLDEETVNMISYQRAYQASARFISTVNDLLNMLVNL